MKVGDLVCYNCAGMRNQTMGYVTSEFITPTRRFFKIRWIKEGEFMPRFSHDYYMLQNIDAPWQSTYYERSGTAELWYEKADLFDVIQ